MKPSDKILTYEQIRELKWFCKNVTGVRTDYNDFLDALNQFDTRLQRLERIADDILNFCEINDIRMMGE